MKTLNTSTPFTSVFWRICGIIFFSFSLPSCNSSSSNSPQYTRPVKKLAIYYGWPSLLETTTNASMSLNDIADTLNQYDVIVFGRNLDLPQTECPCRGYGESSICSNGSNSGHNFWENPNEPWTNHCDHNKTLQIIDDLQTKAKKTLVFGYVSIGGENTFRRYGDISIAQYISEPVPLTISEINSAIDRWAAMGVDGVFLDEAEYGFGATRERQNQIIDRVHNTTNIYGQQLRAFVNSWNPDDVFSTSSVGFVYYPAVNVELRLIGGAITVTHILPHGYSDQDVVNIDSPVQAFNGEKIITTTSETAYTYIIQGTNLPISTQGTSSKRSNNQMNPNGLGTVLSTNDIFLLEHFQIHNGEYQDYLISRADKALKFKTIYGTEIAAITTTKNLPPPNFDQNKFNHAWWSTLLYGFDYLGWGEGNGFSTGEMANLLPLRSFPAIGDIGNVYTSPIVHNANIHRRTTSTTTIEVNTNSGMGNTTSSAMWRFEEGSGNTAFDDTGNGNDGNIISASYSNDVYSFGTESNNYALELNARPEYVEVQGNTVTNLNRFETGLTLEAYIKPKRLPIVQDNIGDMTNYIIWADDDIYSLLLRSDQTGHTSLIGNINCGIRASGTADLSSFGSYAEENGLSRSNIGSNIVMTYGSNKLRLYADRKIIGERIGNCRNEVGPISSRRNIIRIGTDETATMGSNYDRNFKGLIDEVRISSRPLVPAEFLDYNKALYVWRNPARNGVPITEDNFFELALFALSENIGTVFYDKVGKGPLVVGEESDGHEEQAINVLGALIESLHKEGIKVEALITDPSQISSIRDVYNPSVSAAQRFDGIRLHEVTFLNNSDMPVEEGDIHIYQQAVIDAYPLPVFTTINNNWDVEITYNGRYKRAFEHIIDITAGVDILTNSDNSNTIASVSSEEVCYANQNGKLTHLLIETSDLLNDQGATFNDDGKINMKGELVSLNFQRANCNNSLTGYAFHFYKKTFGDSQW